MLKDLKCSICRNQYSCAVMGIGEDAISGCGMFNPVGSPARADPDAVSVVRCKDCAHRDPEDKKCDCGELERAGCVFPVKDDYFCGYGVAKQKVECVLFNEEEIHPDCTVQVLRNSFTGQTSVGWWENKHEQ